MESGQISNLELLIRGASIPVLLTAVNFLTAYLKYDILKEKNEVSQKALLFPTKKPSYFNCLKQPIENFKYALASPFWSKERYLKYLTSELY